MCRWLNQQTDDPDELLSVSTIRRIKNKNCPDVKTDRTKKLVKSENPTPQQSKPSKTIQTNFTIPNEDITPEWLIQQFLNEMAVRLPTFKDGNLVQGLGVLIRMVDNTEIEAIDVEDTMRRFVSNDTLSRKIDNAKY